MSLAIATANSKYVFRRDFTRRAWENISGEGKTCKVQVKKASENYFLKIIPQNGKVNCLSFALPLTLEGWK